MPRIDELRLMGKVARMYYRDGLRQVQITERLTIHQSTVSRLLKRAEKEGIVRVTLTMPSGLHPELEDALQSAYPLREAIVVDTGDQEDLIARDLGAAAAFYLETTLKPRDVIGISSWSAALLAMVEAIHPGPRAGGAQVVQILGGIGSPSAELHATQLTRRLANLLGAVATLLPAPGAVGSADARRVMLKDRYVQEAMALFKTITVALVGIGAVTPSKMLAASGNVFSAKELKSLSDRGAVGDICLRFFDANGVPVITPLNERVIAIELSDLKQVERVVGIAGGRRKFDAIRGALRGRRINVLITDKGTAERLVRSASADGRLSRQPVAAEAPQESR
jgi:DNA-binding transcriptional regulator LsrR (DeoR family)